MHRLVGLALAALLIATAFPAHAIPVFARKYATSCQTCHTVYPKLTPFGEAFRRNGFRFPGVDSDYAKQETVITRPSPPSSEAAWIPAIPPLAVGFNGQAFFHPKKDTSGALADNNASANLQTLIAEAHVWTGGTISDKTSFFGEGTLTSGSADVEHAQLYFNDLIGPAHAFNVRIGRGFSNVSSWGPHSSFLADALLPPSGVAALNGASAGGWNVGDHFNGIEVSGVVADGRVDYNTGWNSGESVDTRTAEDFYGHVGFKVGGMRLDGEGKSNTNAERPWEETAITFDAFGYHAVGSVNFGSAAAPVIVLDTINTVGGGLRAQVGSLELNSGFTLENHKRAEPGLTSATFLSQYNELSYIVVPWFVPAVRVEYSRLDPSSSCTTTDVTGATIACPSVNDLRVSPGVALLPYPNFKVVVTALLESASGAPPSGSWTPSGGFATGNKGLEFQNVQTYIAFAF